MKTVEKVIEKDSSGNNWKDKDFEKSNGKNTKSKIGISEKSGKFEKILKYKSRKVHSINENENIFEYQNKSAAKVNNENQNGFFESHFCQGNNKSEMNFCLKNENFNSSFKSLENNSGQILKSKRISESGKLSKNFNLGIKIVIEGNRNKNKNKNINKNFKIQNLKNFQKPGRHLCNYKKNNTSNRRKNDNLKSKRYKIHSKKMQNFKNGTKFANWKIQKYHEKAIRENCENCICNLNQVILDLSIMLRNRSDILDKIENYKCNLFIDIGSEIFLTNEPDMGGQVRRNLDDTQGLKYIKSENLEDALKQGIASKNGIYPSKHFSQLFPLFLVL